MLGISLMVSGQSSAASTFWPSVAHASIGLTTVAALQKWFSRMLIVQPMHCSVAMRSNVTPAICHPPATCWSCLLPSRGGYWRCLHQEGMAMWGLPRNGILRNSWKIARKRMFASWLGGFKLAESGWDLTRTALGMECSCQSLITPHPRGQIAALHDLGPAVLLAGLQIWQQNRNKYAVRHLLEPAG